MIVSNNKNNKILYTQRSRHNRLTLATLVMLGIFAFLFFTWNDYSEDSTFGFLQNEKPTNTEVEPSNYRADTTGITATVTNAGLVTEDTYGMGNKASQDESKLNSKKVEEQISTIRGEISNEKKTTILAPHASQTSLPSNIFNPETNFKEILNTSPVVLFIRSTEQDSQYLKNLLLKEYEISPQISIVDLDQHSNGDSLQDHIQSTKLSAAATQRLPYLFINSVSVINTNLKKDIKDLHSDGSLLQKFRHLASGNVLFEKMGLPSNS
ncbi:similar to Saccharomyces cerevisiae YPL156C PRM4 Pheromone-regulated protein proposed to be involved in mating [Maudiozyma barnettii]|uniref:Similar to Saccharomyces cerevisiae YPL156C PRM4 Pheromone-regulated protein proposed to be involved in mating n=1 Tax=Maudiozyma barnettii TaxID=61262 RepID=A0A8H2VCT4_9SACH|nr:pheromone-regulated protein PRM4 [Kazachstania barnettii]CAB4252884.1 similar to Saccharomyces cerevisiae YPL156C PRM4 Pheromone-regulated protein proposed to be involved in mating [Kazachstania barnettii]CAD1780679.1 similar to Saccharomyces cerevisiae YPL156C PRM4 Pheromone-regulated protein proposed to be involved in mating [Kazachstania barnettii]